MPWILQGQNRAPRTIAAQTDLHTAAAGLSNATGRAPLQELDRASWHTSPSMPFDEAGNRARVESLRRRGVDAWGAERVYVGSDVNLDAIEPGAAIRQATLSGKDLSIAAGAVIGTSGHAEVRDCQIGPDVELGAGLYQGATFLHRVKVRGFAEIRPGTLLEEEVDIAHSAALKNTTFTACCVAGSLINFCDLLLTGGTSRADHTEVGSGAIHYNFDRRGDKWGSLLGDIRGVLMRSAPVFIGGTCGLVGPLEVGFGAVTAAGSTIRKDVPANSLASAANRAVSVQGLDRNRYGSLRRAFRVTAKLVATLRALDAWYEFVRLPHAPPRERQLYRSAQGQIRIQAQERIDRLGKVVAKLASGTASAAIDQQAQHRNLVEAWPPLREALQRPTPRQTPPARFLQDYARAKRSGQEHLEALKAAEAGAEEAEDWIEAVVNNTLQAANAMLADPGDA
ncbi:MAG: hypothetical protein OXD30_10420 [Bryobacterales bacterium]|nr:hypothetical protein [Bryobacterales bacterium]